MIWSLVFFAFSTCYAVTNFATLPASQTIIEGQDALFSCAVNNGSHPIFVNWRVNSLPIIGANRTLTGSGGAFLGDGGSPLSLTSVSRTLDNSSVLCTARINSAQRVNQPDPAAILTVIYPPTYTLKNGQATTVNVSENYMYKFTFESKPDTMDYNWTKNGEPISNDGRITLAVDAITINSVLKSDGGLYQIESRNEAGRGMGDFTLNVQFPPELNISSNTEFLTVGDSFTMDCSPMDANPSANVFLFSFNSSNINQNDPSVSVNNFVLTISNIQRRHRGTYSCEVSNGIGNAATAAVPVNVVGPPTSPRGLRIVDLQPFSAQVTWSPPEDNGGVEPVHYRGTVSNGTVLDFNTTGITMVTLVHLQHSTNYNVSLIAGNVHGNSSSVEVVFRTNDSMPIIHDVRPEAISLFNITINVTLLTTGGQNVTKFNITVDGTSVMDNTFVHDAKLVNVSIHVGNLTLTKGTDYDVSVTATNSIGTSEPVTGTLSVPNPPNITADLSELSPSTTSPCCAGVRLNLADPDDVSDVSVLLNTSSDGSYEMVNAGNLKLTGDVLYIMGLQAGTVYTANITVGNIFGSTTQQTTLKPLLGRPSNPARPTVTSDGTTVTVVLSTDYPGTERMRSGSMFSFQLQFTKDGRSARQSDTHIPFNSSGLNTPVATTYQGVLSGGSYTVIVTAVNEHGSSESVESEVFVVTEPTQPPQPTDSTPVIVGVVIGVVVAILLVVIIIFVGVILYMKFWKNKGHYLMKKESDTPSNYATNGSRNEKGEIEILENQPAVLYAAVDNSKMSQKEKEVADGQYDDPDVTKPPPTEGLVYADLEFTKKTTDYKKPPPKAEETVIYSEVTLQQQPPPGGSDRDERTHSPTTIM